MVVQLHRTVRFAVGPDIDPAPPLGSNNGSGGHPAMDGLGAQYELDVTCVGTPSPTTGYLINIKAIDHAVRQAAIPLIAAAFGTPEARPATMLPALADAIAEQLEPHVASIAWRLTPSLTLEYAMNDREHACIRQRFEFAASHRLHTPALSDQENRELYGKCNNPSGHGHNYTVEPCVALPIRGEAATLTLAVLERLADELIVERFDHKHLNVDTEEFGPEGLNPSVENIAKVCFERLADAVAAHGGELRSVTVWETERTSCTYPG
ncbi:MAG: 6-carboxytetrahydropterin synthase [Planctomycetota bacterium]